MLPFTGGLAAYGANLDRAVKVAVGLQNPALKRTGYSKKISVRLVGSEDGQTQASASVEAATKLVKSNHANVLIGEMASSATIPMAQSVRSESRRADLADLERAADHRHQGQRLPLADLSFRRSPGRGPRKGSDRRIGEGAAVDVGTRNDAFGTALKQLFVAQFTKLGGKVGVNISWNPEQRAWRARSDGSRTEARRAG